MKRAFTLSEILMTLAIIGIIAAITIPNLVKNYQKKQVVEQLKEAYSIINNALNAGAANNSVKISDTVNFGLYDTSESSYCTVEKNFIQTYFLPYVQVQKDCGCLSSSTCKMVPRYFLNKTVVADTNGGNYVLYLKNGMYLRVVPNNNGTNLSDMFINVDINGDKLPNVYGKDVFQFYIAPSSKGFSFIGAQYARDTLLSTTTRGCNKDAPIPGGYCGAVIQADGWQIKDDYPW